MYRILTEDGVQIAVTETPTFIKVGRSGAYATADRETAEGIAVAGKPCSLFGKAPLPGADETVMISEFDGGKRIEELEAQLDYIAMMTDVDLDFED